MKIHLKKLNNSGVAHHALVALLLIAGFASFGAWRVFSSSASSSQYVVPVNEALGCDLSGRVYDDKSTRDNKCQPKCKNADAKYIAYDSKTKRPAYCQGHINTEMSQAQCIDQLHRAYVDNLGCARKANQDSSNKSKYCPNPAYPNYVAEGNVDRCIADKVVTPPKSQDGTTVQQTSDPISRADCALLGRSSKDSTTCSRVCVENAGALLQDTISKVVYCQSAVATDISEARCKNLNRVWLKAGCARRIDQKDTLNAPQCVAGFPYYNADFQTSATVTKIDVCEKDKATATANEQAGNLGGTQVTAKNTNSNPGPTDQCASPNAGQTASRCIAPQDQSDCPAGKVKNSKGKCVAAPNTPSTPGTSSAPSDPVDESTSEFKITVYRDKDFKGKSKEYTSTQALLADGMNDSISSIKVQKGRWQICEDKDFQTNCHKVWASDPDLSKVGKDNLNDKISSLRPVVTTTFEDAPQDIIAICSTASGMTVAATSDNTCPAEASLTCPVGYVLNGSDCKEEVLKQDIVIPVNSSFKGDEGRVKCQLLGREWIGEVKNKLVNDGAYGCSEVTCALEKDGAPRKFKNGPVCVSYKYDKPYAQDIEEAKCKDLHRVWIDQVKRCAQMPNRKDKDQTKVNAEQCEPGFSTYYIYKSADREDECFKPQFFQKVRAVAASTGGVLGAGLQQGPKLFCNTVKSGNYHWNGKKCVIDRKKCWNGASVAVTDTCPARPDPTGGVPSQEPETDSTSAPNGASWSSFCASLGRTQSGNGCSASCSDGSSARNPRATSYGYDRCQPKSQVCEEDRTGGSKDCVPAVASPAGSDHCSSSICNPNQPTRRETISCVEMNQRFGTENRCIYYYTVTVYEGHPSKLEGCKSPGNVQFYSFSRRTATYIKLPTIYYAYDAC